MLFCRRRTEKKYSQYNKIKNKLKTRQGLVSRNALSLRQLGEGPHGWVWMAACDQCGAGWGPMTTILLYCVYCILCIL